MRPILITLIFMVLSISVFASDTTIVFRQIGYSELFDIAKKENKAVMLYFHFDGCGACIKMEKTAFKEKKVYDFYNSNFINLEINTRKGNGIEVNKIYNIQLHPTFIFLDNSGNELHRIVGIYSPEEFLKQAHNALNSDKTLTNYKKQYNNSNRNADFLFDYSYMLRDASELDSLVVNEYLNAIDPTDFFLEKNVRFVYEFCVHDFKIFIPFKNPYFSFLLQNKETFYKYFDKDQVNTRIVWILKNAIYKAIEDEDESTFNSAIQILKGYDTGEQYLFKEMDGRLTGMITSKNLVLSSLLAFYDRNGDRIKYKQTLDEYLTKIWNDAAELNNFAWGIYEQAKNEETDKIKAAVKCSIRSIELANNYANNDTYACLLYKLSEKKKALKQAEKAIGIAKQNSEDYTETQKLIDKIKATK